MPLTVSSRDPALSPSEGISREMGVEEAPLLSLFGRVPRLAFAPTTIEVVAQALMTRAVASWLCRKAILHLLVPGISDGSVAIFRQQARGLHS